MENYLLDTEEKLQRLIGKLTPEQRINGFHLTYAKDYTKDSFWDIQRKMTIIERTRIYPLILLYFINEEKIGSEINYIENELSFYYNLLDLSQEIKIKHERAFHNIRSYIEFLESRFQKLNERELDDTVNKYKKLPCVLPKTKLIALLLLSIKDNGIIPEQINDYVFSQWVENSFLFDCSQEVKYAKQEISKFRQLEIDTEKYAVELKELLKSAKIKVNDDLN